MAQDLRLKTSTYFNKFLAAYDHESLAIVNSIAGVGIVMLIRLNSKLSIWLCKLDLYH